MKGSVKRSGSSFKGDRTEHLKLATENWLICFAVKEETAFFRPPDDACQVMLTGMGQKNAERSLRQAITENRPDLVITSGCAGGLDPKLKLGDVVYDLDAELGFQSVLEQQGAIPARFHCYPRVAATAEEKRKLRAETGADVVEMESGVIRRICREEGISSATVRVILDAAEDELPLDFNELIDADQNLSYAKLAGKIAGRPTLIPRLLRFQSQTKEVARKLAVVLTELRRTNRAPEPRE